MSLYELYGLAKGKHKSGQQSAEPHSLPGSDFAELVWENGQVVMQGQPNRARKPTNNVISLEEDLPQKSRLKNKEMGGLTRLGIMESAIPVPSELDDVVPCLRYHHMDEDDPVQHHNYTSDFYAELPDAIKEDSHVPNPAERMPIRPQGSKLDQLSSHQSICSFPSFRPKVSDIYRSCLNNGTRKLLLGDSSSVYPRMKMQRTQDPPGSTIMNFSHFSKHATMVRDTKAGLEASVAKQMDGKEIRSVLIGAKQAEASQVASMISGQQIRDSSRYHSQLKSANHSGLVSCQDIKNIDIPPKQVVVPNGNMATGNVAEPVVASSVCSGNSADRASNDPTYDLKRKYHEYEESEYNSEDIEEESVGIRKAVGSGSKRSRAAEVHNLSERRRRDRINEKMRELQELIPNCNKVDKASMLDEAIKYLKTLQLQVQMMSMGPGLCMPPMMLPHAAHMPQFSPMSVGMGMGMGYGSGMLGNPSNYQLVQMPYVQGTRFPMASAPGLGMTATPLPNLPMYGFQGQGIGMPMSCAPASSYPAGPPSRPVMDLNMLSSVHPVGDLGSVQTSQIKDTVQNDDNFVQGFISSQAANDAHLLPMSKTVDSSTKVDVIPVRETL